MQNRHCKSADNIGISHLQDLAEKIEQLNAAIDEVSSKIGQEQPAEETAGVS